MDLPSDDTLRLLVSRYASFKAAHGAAVGTPDLVQPTGEFFPDEFKGDAESVAGFLKRLLSYAPLASDQPVAMRFIEPKTEEASGGGGCSSGGCSTGGGSRAGVRDTVSELEDGYLVDINVGDVGTSTMLSTTLARSAGAIVLREAGEVVDGRSGSDPGVECEIAAVACGFGVLLTNGSYVYAKGCGGVRVHQGTVLSVEEHAVLLALFVRDHELRASSARAHLDTTPAEAFDVALEWVDSNPEIVGALRARPEALAAGLFAIQPIKGFFGRLFAPKPRSEPDFGKIVVPRRVRTPDEERRIAESRRLVEEALGKG